MFKWLRNRIELLKNDKQLALIMLLHIVLIGLHVYEWKVGDIEYYWYLRAGGCGLIALFIFLFGRKGLAWSLVIFACTLVYINNFYNYATIFFMLVAMGADPKLRKVAPWIYLVNVFVAYTMKRLGITPFAIHLIYCVMFYTKMNYVFAIHKPEKLNLTDSERQILDLKLQGKMQKEIDLYSPQTITAKMKSARERNLCETTEELMAKYAKEKESE
ncbi:hypothetical protein SAMN04487977_101503 [Treponema bryantii]|uniref:Uncharacterized protein n=1 Tax=Treponema bryantii TaxID=163 RepID=A0A1H9AX02_9SPIR|nr:hypothetical protein [Treponema bryantii]SEP81332.1 hypothetical protein SAMN04487977_101503 [Treponema bryantii]